MDEFELIRRFFDRRVTTPGVVVGIGDDGAVLHPEPGRDQIQVIDTLVEGVHFPADLPAADVGYRVVAVNLSDIAAMGGSPRWMTLALTLPRTDERWLTEFATGLFEAAAEFDVALVGGDTTSGDAVVATVQMTGEVEAGQAILRSGARIGDTIFTTGTPGDAAAGLELFGRGERDNVLVRRFLRPSARIATGRRLIGRASAAIDVSDGLVGDLTKLLEASGVAGELAIERLPLSDALRARFEKADSVRFALTGGDDYELCFTAAPAAVDDIPGITAIGKVVSGQGLKCLHDGDIVDYGDSGYRHFQ
ncbi:MAG: thiamine-phosphate kinase [Gammaproteobacteria bacterium]|nr:thiamine-phosphate kinase [Gammaproteobacteria bacterium]NNL50171.1 thiamine-phosphate kinase [Woeseiaceae bacterium]